MLVAPHIHQSTRRIHMSSLLLTSYILVWPVISTVVLVVLLVALVRDMRAARQNGDSMV